jgi:putative ABC transport system permease protein
MGDRVYRWLLGLYPAEFRRRYGHDMVEMFRDARGDCPPGTWSSVKRWTKTCRDLLVSAAVMRFGGERARSRRPGSVSAARILSSTTRSTIMESLVSDVRYAFRTLWKSKGFATVALVTIALGIGANSAIFSVVNAVLLRPLPYPAPDRLVTLWTQFPAGGDPIFAVSPAEYLDYRAESRAFAEMGAFSVGTSTVTGEGAAARIEVAATSASLFQVLGFRAHVGRLYTAEDDRPGNNQVAVLSHGFWLRRYGGTGDALGQSLVINGVAYEIIGVMAEGVKLPGATADVWVPFGYDRAQITDRSGHFLEVVGRLAPNATYGSAVAELEAILARWPDVYAGQHTPNPETHPMTLIALNDHLLGGIRPAMLVLAGAVGAVLLLACANVANLLLARGEGRSREIGLRAALGAGRGRISRQLLTESVVIAVAGGGLGLVLGKLGIDMLVRLEPGEIPRLGQVGLDASVVAFTVALSVATGVVFGLLPSLKASRTDLTTILTSGGRSGGQGHDTRRTLSGLVVAQVALAVVLLIGSGLLLKSFAVLQRVDPGFTPDNRLAFDVGLAAADYPDMEAIMGFYGAVTEGVGALPGVTDVAVVRNLPLHLYSRQEGVQIEGKVNSENEGSYPIQYQGVSPEYFSVMGVPLLRGRVFDRTDRRGGPVVAVINETMARTYWPDEDPLGWRMDPGFARDIDWITVVGVVGDVRQTDLAATVKPEMYVSLEQVPGGFGWIRSASVIVRTDLDADALSSSIRAVVAGVDEDVPVANLQSLKAVVAETLNEERFVMLLLAIFAGGALLIAAVGVYGVISFSVARRTQEIGIRMALGAPQRRVLGEIVSSGTRLAAAGAAIGVTLAFLSSRVLESQLYGVSVRDMFVFTTGAGMLLLVSLVASLVPAYRASRVDPNASLRTE